MSCCVGEEISVGMKGNKTLTTKKLSKNTLDMGLCKKSFVLFPQPIIFFLRDFEEEKQSFSSSKSLKNRII
jgi:hypothetical protein